MKAGGGKQKGRPGLEFYVFITLALVSFITLFVSSRSAMTGARNLGLSMFSGIRGGIHGASSAVSRTILSIRELATLRREYAELTERVARYEQLERTSAEIRLENNRLREQLGFSRDLRYRHIPAELIGRDPDNLFSAFVISKGTRAGVGVDMPVIAYQNGTQALVGKILHAGAFESLVMPLYDESCFVASRFAESRYEGIVEGRGDSDTPLLMRYIRKRAREEINIGDMAVSSGLGRVYPPGINVGRVSGINYQETELSMEVELEPSIDFSRLEYVFVLEPASSTAPVTEETAPAAALETEGSND